MKYNEEYRGVVSKVEEILGRGFIKKAGRRSSINEIGENAERNLERVNAGHREAFKKLLSYWKFAQDQGENMFKDLVLMSVPLFNDEEHRQTAISVSFAFCSDTLNGDEPKLAGCYDCGLCDDFV